MKTCSVNPYTLLQRIHQHMRIAKDHMHVISVNSVSSVANQMQAQEHA